MHEANILRKEGGGQESENYIKPCGNPINNHLGPKTNIKTREIP